MVFAISGCSPGCSFLSVDATLVANPGILRRARRTHAGFVISPGRRLRTNALMAGEKGPSHRCCPGRRRLRQASRPGPRRCAGACCVRLAARQRTTRPALAGRVPRPRRSGTRSHFATIFKGASSIRHCSALSMALIERMAFVETWNSWNSSNGLVRLSCCRAACASSAESARTARPLRNAWFRNPPLRSAGSSHAPDSRIGALQCWYSGVFGVPNTAARRTRKPATAL